MDLRIRELERLALLDPTLRPALTRARRRACLPPLDLPGIVAELERHEADLARARDACGLELARLLGPFVAALFAETPGLDVALVSCADAPRSLVHVAVDGREVLALGGGDAIADTRAGDPRVHRAWRPWLINALDEAAQAQVREAVLAFAPALPALAPGERLVLRRTRRGQVVVEAPDRPLIRLPSAVTAAAREPDRELRELLLAEQGAREVAPWAVLDAYAVEPAAPLSVREALLRAARAQGALAERRTEAAAAARDALQRVGPALFEAHPDLSLAALTLVLRRRPGQPVAALATTSCSGMAWMADVLADAGHDDLGLAAARGGRAGDRPAVRRALEPLGRLLAPVEDLPCVLVLAREAHGVVVRRGPWPRG